MRQRDYIIKKFVRASSAADAIRKSVKVPIGEVYEAEDKPEAYEILEDQIGFSIPHLDED